MTCECCWSDRSPFSEDPAEAYTKARARHEQDGCICTKNTLEGRRARAGQFWSDALECDRRGSNSGGGDGE